MCIRDSEGTDCCRGCRNTMVPGTKGIIEAPSRLPSSASSLRRFGWGCAISAASAAVACGVELELNTSEAVAAVGGAPFAAALAAVASSPSPSSEGAVLLDSETEAALDCALFLADLDTNTALSDCCERKKNTLCPPCTYSRPRSPTC